MTPHPHLAPGRAYVAGLARRAGRKQPMELLESAEITVSDGLVGDHKGARFPTRQITVLAEEDWLAALKELECGAVGSVLPWTARRANVLTRGIVLPRGKGSRISLGRVELEITGITFPCQRMNEVHPGLLKALARHGRGGVTARVIAGSALTLGASISVLRNCPERRPRLPD